MVMLFLFVSVTMILLVNWEVEEPKRNESAQLTSITITMDRHWIMVIIFNLKYLLITCTKIKISHFSNFNHLLSWMMQFVLFVYQQEDPKVNLVKRVQSQDTDTKMKVWKIKLIKFRINNQSEFFIKLVQFHWEFVKLTFQLLMIKIVLSKSMQSLRNYLYFQQAAFVQVNF